MYLHPNKKGKAIIDLALRCFINTAILVNPSQYNPIINELKETGGKISLETRTELMKEAFAHTAHYDAVIAGYWKAKTSEEVRNTYPEVIEK